MTGDIILTKTPRFTDTSRWNNPVCVHDDNHGGIVTCDSVSLDEFSDHPREVAEEYDTVVLHRLSQMMTPSNRTDDVWEFVFNQMDTTTASVDEYLFRSDPWRSWFHFGAVNAEYRDYTYSYLAETDYDQYFNGQTDDNPFAVDEVLQWGDGVVESQYETYFNKFEVNIDYETDASEQYEYSELLDELFQEKNTVGQVRRSLESYASDIYDDRNIPTRHQLFKNGTEWEVSITDLPIDVWKASHLKELVTLTNGIAEGLYVE